MTDASIEGLDDVLRRFSALPDRVREEVKASMERGARRVVKTMKRLCPKESGKLAQSIGWTWGAAPEGSMVLGEVRGSEETLTIVIYAGSRETLVFNKRGVAFQNAKLQEFGTKEMPAHPYFYPAWRLSKRGFKAANKRAVTKAVKEIFGNS